MKKHFWLVLLIAMPHVGQSADIIAASRANCVQILFNTNTPVGSGFLLDQQHVATCFHVAESTQIISNGLRWNVRPSLYVELADGTRVPASFISEPTENDIRPIVFDFAILSLDHPVTNGVSLPFCTNTAVGTPIVFSGFPLRAPMMLTHKGMISGLTPDQSEIALDASINKGNSGGAVLNTNGEIIGIISMKVGGLSKELSDARDAVRNMGDRIAKTVYDTDTGPVNPLDLTLKTIDTIDDYISTGIGYAYNIRFLDAYLHDHPLTTSNKTEKAHP